MITTNNVLNEESIKNIVSIMEYEIKNNLCLTVPKYQSYNNMHIKYAHDKNFKFFLNEVEQQKKKLVSEKLLLQNCWFNICRKDSEFKFHTHAGMNCTAVFFVKNCKDNGTLFQFDNSYLQLKVEDNSLVFFNPQILHSIPKWESVDRYTIAFDFVEGLLEHTEEGDYT